jgi:hypothetical protein
LLRKTCNRRRADRDLLEKNTKLTT